MLKIKKFDIMLISKISTLCCLKREMITHVMYSEKMTKKMEDQYVIIFLFCS